MSFFLERRRRQSIRLRGYDYSAPGGYFITMSIREKECLLGTITDGHVQLNAYGLIVENMLASIPNRYLGCSVDSHIIMPNHVHLLLEIHRRNARNVGAIHESPLHTESHLSSGSPLHIYRRRMTIPKIVGFLKMNSAKAINSLRQSQGTPVWQRNYYEHIVRNRQELFSIKNYINNNPRNWSDDPENPLNS